jgi:sulfopyruvate decarboxylase subunit alpha/phosphonopyruvate decarboxylase
MSDCGSLGNLKGSTERLQMISQVASDRASELAVSLRASGYGPYFGTPCGILAPLYRELSENAGLTTVVREDNAIAVAAGCALAGAKPVVLMQNSGLGNSVNALASLVVPYQLPILLVVSLRGAEGDSTAENEVMGRLTPIVLENMGIPHRVLDSRPMDDAVVWARDWLTEQHRSAALVVLPGLFGWRP